MLMLVKSVQIHFRGYMIHARIFSSYSQNTIDMYNWNFAHDLDYGKKNFTLIFEIALPSGTESLKTQQSLTCQ